MSIDQQEEFEGMKRIGAIVANCLALLKTKARPGMSTRELDEIAARYIDEQGAIAAPPSEYNFPGAVCLSVERTVAHGIPDDTVLRDGDLLNIDVSAHLDGYYADNGESIVVGKAPRLKRSLCKAVHKALQVALRHVRDGVRVARMGREIERLARAQGFTVIENLGGHGVGRSLHEEPTFLSSVENRHDRRMFQKNQVVAIEPFLSNGATWVHEGDDGWALYHPEYYSVQKEHTVMITKGRPYIFTQPDTSFA